MAMISIEYDVDMHMIIKGDGAEGGAAVNYPTFSKGGPCPGEADQYFLN